MLCIADTVVSQLDVSALAVINMARGATCLLLSAPDLLIFLLSVAGFFDPLSFFLGSMAF